ncbi:MAG: GHKL domain-containing protein [Phycisphaerales bacterium]|nr:GHKL domain-containing protein [Phycisphaerales bacterium]
MATRARTICNLTPLLGRVHALVTRLTPRPVEALDEEWERRRRTVIAYWWIGAMPWPIAFIVIYGLVLNCPVGSAICAAALLALLPIPQFARSRAGIQFAAHWLMAVMVVSLAALACITGGDGAPALVWLLAVPLVGIYIGGLRPGMLWCGAALTVFIAFHALRQNGFTFPQHLPERELGHLAVVANMGLTLLIATLAGAYDAQRLAAVKLADDRQENLKAALGRAEEQARELERNSLALRESEALYRSLVQNSPMGMYFYSLNEKDELILTGANPAADRFTRVDSRTRLGLTLEQAFPSVAGTEIPARYRAAANDGTAWAVDQLAYDDGTITGIFELRAFQTSPRKMVAVFIDVTDRVRAEAAVRASEREIALQAGKAEVATHVLHNVGNVLSRVKVSATLLRESVMNSETPTVGRVAGLLAENREALATFFHEDDRGRSLPGFLQNLADILAAEQAAIAAELKRMSEAIEHIALVISMQQVHSKGGSLEELVRPGEIVEQAIGISVSARAAETVELVREIEDTDAHMLQRHKVLQILVNLFSNAVHAVSGVARPRIRCRVVRRNGAAGDVLHISVSDNGIGISHEHLPRIFKFGFTTRRDGHGFGLHSSANLAQEMGGAIHVASEGEGRGATFTLELPLQAARVQS